MRRMYSQSQLEAIIRGLIPETSNTHVYALNKDDTGASAGSQTTVYFVSDKEITSASDITAEDIYNKVIGVNHHEWLEDAYSDLWVSLGNFATKANGQINFYRIKQRDDGGEKFAGISDSNISLATLKTYTLTKLV